MISFCLLQVSLMWNIPSAGSIFLLLSGPILLIAFLAIAHLIISGEDEFHQYVISWFKVLMPELLIQNFLLFIYSLFCVVLWTLCYSKKNSKYPSVRLWTFPVLVDGPFGVVSAAEFIGILLFVVYIIWAVYVYTLRNLSLISQLHLTSKDEGYSVFCFDILICIAYLLFMRLNYIYFSFSLVLTCFPLYWWPSNPCFFLVFFYYFIFHS